jgi:molybdate transport system ATP-binding protein
MINLDISKQLETNNGKLNLEVKLDINQGDFVTLFGKSGVGKTTLLRIIAGLSNPEKGSLNVDGQSWFDSKNKINLP